MRIQASGADCREGAWPLGRGAAGRGAVRQRRWRGVVWRTVTVSGKPVAPPAAAANGMALDKRVFALDGHPTDPAHIKQGDKLIIRLSGRATARRDSLGRGG